MKSTITQVNVWTTVEVIIGTDEDGDEHFIDLDDLTTKIYGGTSLQAAINTLLHLSIWDDDMLKGIDVPALEARLIEEISHG